MKGKMFIKVQKINEKIEELKLSKRRYKINCKYKIIAHFYNHER